MAITLSKVASERISEYMDNRGHGYGVRVGVRTTGCSGLAYIVEFVDNIEENDTVFVSNNMVLSWIMVVMDLTRVSSSIIQMQKMNAAVAKVSLYNNL